MKNLLKKFLMILILIRTIYLMSEEYRVLVGKIEKNYLNNEIFKKLFNKYKIDGYIVQNDEYFNEHVDSSNDRLKFIITWFSRVCINFKEKNYLCKIDNTGSLPIR